MLPVLLLLLPSLELASSRTGVPVPRVPVLRFSTTEHTPARCCARQATSTIGPQWYHGCVVEKPQVTHLRPLFGRFGGLGWRGGKARRLTDSHWHHTAGFHGVFTLT